VLADRESVRLDLGAVDLDLVEFDRAQDDAAVVAAHGGGLLPDDVDAPWAAPTRAEVGARFAAAAARCARAHLDAARPGAAAVVARQLLEADPHDLRGHELVLAALLASDQHDAAAAAHAAWVAAAAPLGVRVPPLDPA